MRSPTDTQDTRATSITPVWSYIICCTPRSGSHLLSDGLASTGIAGYPVERFPRHPTGVKVTAAQADAMVTEAPPESWYDPKLDREYIKHILAQGTTDNGAFGLTLHWFQVNDAVRRLRDYLQVDSITPQRLFALAFPNLTYIWLKRRDKIAQAVSWYKAIQTGEYVKLRDAADCEAVCRTEAVFDYTRIKTYWAALRSYENGWNNFFTEGGLNPLVVHYEDLCNNYDESIHSILGSMRLSHENIGIKAPHFEKSADTLSFEWIAKFKAMQVSGRPRPG